MINQLYFINNSLNNNSKNEQKNENESFEDRRLDINNNIKRLKYKSKEKQQKQSWERAKKKRK